ncbi:MAG: DNA modification methylase [Candidatus Lambdaproteobacteria bacterium]|nr:DNA modification methylase [Candidatus Lambdaproteobacteria bacterium]
MTIDALNAVCPYYTMYPLSFPISVLNKNGRKGDWVLDPFCGRGTTNFAARMLRMPSCGIDSSPVAAAVARAKLVYATPARVVACAKSILQQKGSPRMPSGEFWELAYHPETLADICRLRETLVTSASSATRVLLRAIILGALHGPRPKGRPSYFSNQAPRTFAPKPRYAAKFWRDRGLLPTKINVLDVIADRAARCLSDRPPDVDGHIILDDSRRAEVFRDIPPPAWVVTSPPYYGMRTYLPDQWLRLWFLGGPDRVVYEQPESQLEHTSADHFAQQMAMVWANVLQLASERTRMVVRFGGIHDRDVEPMDILRTSLRSSGWRITTARAAPDAETGRRQVRQFQSFPKKGVTEYDVYCCPS